MHDIGSIPQKKRDVYMEIKKHLTSSLVDECSPGEIILMKEAMRKGGYFVKEEKESEFDAAMIKVVDDVWRRYDPENIGVMHKNQCEFLVKNVMAEMKVEFDLPAFNKKDFLKLFDLVDNNNSGTVVKEEAA
jgi:hypothetical protein